MAVYVDPLCNHGWVLRGRAVKSCHLFTDGDIDELHAMAERIGLKRRWFQCGNKRLPHYDLTESRRNAAISLGVIALSRAEAARLWRMLREAVTDA